MEGNIIDDNGKEEKDDYMKQIQDLTESFTRLKNSKEVMGSKIAEYEKKIQELQTENEKKTMELKTIKEERRSLLSDLELSRYEIVKLTEENVALKRRLEKRKESERNVQENSEQVSRGEEGHDNENSVATNNSGQEITEMIESETSRDTSEKEIRSDADKGEQQEEQQAVDQENCIVYQSFESEGVGFKTKVPITVLQNEKLASEVISSSYNDANTESGISLPYGETIDISSKADSPSAQKETSNSAPDSSVTINRDITSNLDSSCTAVQDESRSDVLSTSDTNLTSNSTNEKHAPDQESSSSAISSENKSTSDQESVNTSKKTSCSDQESFTAAKENTSTNQDSSSPAKEQPALETDAVSAEIENTNSETTLANSEVNMSASKIRSPRSKKKKSTSKIRTRSSKIESAAHPVSEIPTGTSSASEKESSNAIHNLSNSQIITSIEDLYTFSIENETPPIRSVMAYSQKGSTSSKRKWSSQAGLTSNTAGVSTRKKTVALMNNLAESSKEVTPSRMKTRGEIKKEKDAENVKKELSTQKKNLPKKRLSYQKKSRQSSSQTDVAENMPDLTGIYFCSPCDLGFTTELNFDRHILFRHSGAGLDQTLPSLEPVNSVQIPSENGVKTKKKSKKSPPVLEKQTNGNEQKIEKESKSNPPVLKRENLAVDSDVDKPKNITFKRHECSICGKRFTAAVTLRAHLNMHNGIRPFECSICHTKFFSKADRNKHLKTHNPDKPCICTMCGKGFATSQYLNHHLNTHKPERKFGCDVCGKRFKQKPHLEKHVKLIHKNERTHMCDVCGKSFGTSYSLANHMTTHTKVKLFNCDTCGKSFGNRDYLHKHQMYHTGERKYMCIQCKKSFHLSTDLRRHMRIHTNYKPFSCAHKNCDYKAALAANMRAHAVKHMGVEFSCRFCVKKYVSDAALKRHVKMVHGE